MGDFQQLFSNDFLNEFVAIRTPSFAPLFFKKLFHTLR
jgi:hypothetical protein